MEVYLPFIEDRLKNPESFQIIEFLQAWSQEIFSFWVPSSGQPGEGGSFLNAQKKPSLTADFVIVREADWSKIEDSIIFVRDSLQDISAASDTLRNYCEICSLPFSAG